MHPPGDATGHNNCCSVYLLLNAVKCFDTFHEILMYSADSDLFLEGTSVTLSCPPGLVLIGHSISTSVSFSKDSQSQQIEYASSTIGHTIVPPE